MKAHTPDPTRYHEENGRTIIARHDPAGEGTSLGFDVNKPGIMHIDPHLPDGSIVNLDRLNDSDVQAALRSAGNSAGAYALLGQQQQKTAAVALPPSTPQPAAPQPRAAVGPKLAPLPGGPPPSAPQTAPAPPVEMQALAGLMTAFLASQQPARAPIALSEPDRVPFGLEFLDAGPKPPKVQVVFRQGGGLTAARFHHVSASRAGVLLAYDTRFEYGVQHLPAASDDFLTLELAEPVLVPGVEQPQPLLVVCSLGFHFNLGPLDLLVLPFPPPDRPPQENS